MSRQDSTIKLAEQAWEWLDRLEEADDRARAEFAGWLGESPRHIEEFLLASALHREFEGVDAARRIDIDGLLASYRANVVALPGNAAAPGERASGNRRPRWIGPAIAAGVVGLAIAVSIATFATFPRWLGYATAVGEQRTLELEDGSLVFLNTQSRVRVAYSGAARDVHLVAGEALFQVAKEADRPFRVHAGRAVVQAVGTQFNVYRRGQDTSVAVLEGTVRVSTKDAALVTAGQSAHIAQSGAITRGSAADAEKVNAWRQRRLVFRADLLTDVAAEFNRYNRSPRIRVEGSVPRNKRITGVFDADDPELLLTFLRSDAELKIKRAADEVVIYSQPPGR